MLRFGIIGCGAIAHNMAATINASSGSTLLAAAAREQSRAAMFVRQYGASRAYGSYEQLVHDPDIQAVYIATIHPTHYETAKLCLENGKYVLCEKPLTMNRTQAEELFALAQEKNLLLMEAIWTRFLPSWQAAKRRVQSGDIGRLLTVYADLTIPVAFNPDSRMFNLEKGGGALLDLGVYALHAALFMLGADYSTIHAVGRLSKTGSDCFAAVTLQYPDGRTAHASCGMDCRGTKSARLMGEKGEIIIPNIVGADHYIISRGDTAETVQLPFENGFAFELEEFEHLISRGATESNIASPAHTLAVMGIIDEAMRQIKGTR